MVLSAKLYAGSTAVLQKEQKESKEGLLQQESANINNSENNASSNKLMKAKQTFSPNNSSSQAFVRKIAAFENQKVNSKLHSENPQTKIANSGQLPSQSYYGLGIPKSPSFHCGLDLLADDEDNSDPMQATNSSESGLKFKFSNIEELKAKFENKKMPSPPNLEQSSSSGTSSTASSVNSSTSSLSQVASSSAAATLSSSSLSAVGGGGAGTNSAAAALVASSPFNSSSSTSLSLSSSSSPPKIATNGSTAVSTSGSPSLVSTLAQHFNAATTSATALLTTTSSSSASVSLINQNNKSPVSAATAIKNILNSTKSVGNSAASTGNNSSGKNHNEEQNLPAKNTSNTGKSTASSNSTSVAQNLLSGITASLGIESNGGSGIVVGDGSKTSSNNKATSGSVNQFINTISITSMKATSSSISVNFQNGSGKDDKFSSANISRKQNKQNMEGNTCGMVSNNVGSSENSNNILSPQTLQQITGSPGRARDRHLFNSPSSNAAANALPLLRGF